MRYRFFKKESELNSYVIESGIYRENFMSPDAIGGKTRTLYDTQMELIFFEIELNYQVQIGYEIHHSLHPSDYPHLWVCDTSYPKVSRVIMFDSHLAIELK